MRLTYKLVAAAVSVTATSFGIAQTVYTIPDATTDGTAQTGYGSGPDITPVGFTGIDDTFTGNVSITFDIDITTANETLAAAAANFTFFDAGTRILAVGNGWFTPNWSFWKARPDGAEYDLLDSESNPVAIGDGFVGSDSTTLTVSIDFVAGGDDSGLVKFADDSASAALPVGDYTFDELMAGGYGPIVAYTNGTLTVTTAVPEPSALAMLLGLSGLAVAFLRRRR